MHFAIYFSILFLTIFYRFLYTHFSYIFETCKFFFSPFLFNKDEQLHNRETTITFPPVITISFKTAMGKGNVLNTNVSNLFFPVKNRKKKKKKKKSLVPSEQTEITFTTLTFSFNFYAFTQAFN